MQVTPFFLAILTLSTICRIGLYLLAMIVSATPTLTIELTANDLVGMIGRRRKELKAIGTVASHATASHHICSELVPKESRHFVVNFNKSSIMT